MNNTVQERGSERLFHFPFRLRDILHQWSQQQTNDRHRDPLPLHYSRRNARIPRVCLESPDGGRHVACGDDVLPELIAVLITFYVERQNGRKGNDNVRERLLLE